MVKAASNQQVRADSARVACTCAALRRAARRVTRHYDATMRTSGLKLTQFSMLMNISRQPGCSLTDLAAGMAMDRTTLTRNLHLLRRDGLIAVGRGGDSRVRCAELTEQGRVRLEAALPHWQAAEGEVRELLGQERSESLHGLLSEIVRGV